jgi:hypothetical protein
LNPDDIPRLANRGRYVRQDGSEYQYDVCGKAFEIDAETGHVYPGDSYKEAAKALHPEVKV